MALANTVNSYAQTTGNQASMARGVHTAIYSGESSTRTTHGRWRFARCSYEQQPH